ncbi:hypothetical protein RRG08_011920 [Elysia crispata]|uniref:Uncharacterized protein n=1 Tax=Elysia crispata TaxID=231223 RepID=A0AAE0Y856_9GAST|nr:hypothetical protein RRG08_011920 [Elysia crispata]
MFSSNYPVHSSYCQSSHKSFGRAIKLIIRVLTYSAVKTGSANFFTFSPLSLGENFFLRTFCLSLAVFNLSPAGTSVNYVAVRWRWTSLYLDASLLSGPQVPGHRLPASSAGRELVKSLRSATSGRLWP